MNIVHHDLPHPIPPTAYLRYKENYFFVVKAPESGVFGQAHLNFEPLFERARFTSNFQIHGKSYEYANTTGFPENFEGSRSLSDGVVSVAFVEPDTRFDFSTNSDEIDLQIIFEKRFPSFDLNYCRWGAPENPTFQEAITLGANLQVNQHQQAMTVRGHVVIKATGERVEIQGYGYRDHSWSIRSDNAVGEHTWCGFNFPSLAIGVKTLRTLYRPGTEAKEGYVVDASGARALRGIRVRGEGATADGWPAKLIHELTDVLGRTYTLESDVAGRLAHVPLTSEAPGRHVYEIAENFCRSRLVENGEEGVGIVELGRSSGLNTDRP